MNGIVCLNSPNKVSKKPSLTTAPSEVAAEDADGVKDQAQTCMHVPRDGTARL